jgi:hypothetical protein
MTRNDSTLATPLLALTMPNIYITPKSTQNTEIMLFIFTYKNDTDSQGVRQNGTKFPLPEQVLPQNVNNCF